MKQIQINNTIVEAVKGDIVKQEIDAIVNAANSHLMGGGGVDGAIHAAGGSSIMADTDRRYPAGCLTGSAVASTAGRLKAKCVIHAVAPRYSSNPVCPELLYKAYYNSLLVAVRNDCTSVAFPSLGTGAYRYPLDEAAPIALKAVRDFLQKHDSITLIRFVLFDDKTLTAFEKELEKLTQ
ncbi:MAG: macro domain-containing protein [Thermoguttaceae bacterium]|nr:macro domain-containing protein [Thermoguttaceae bacterium]